jgi:hypothetical protein
VRVAAAAAQRQRQRHRLDKAKGAVQTQAQARAQAGKGEGRGSCDSASRVEGGGKRGACYWIFAGHECAERALITLIGIARRCGAGGGGGDSGGAVATRLARCARWALGRRSLWHQRLLSISCLLLMMMRRDKSLCAHVPSSGWSGVRAKSSATRQADAHPEIAEEHYFGCPGRLGRRNVLVDGSAVVMPAR